MSRICAASAGPTIATTSLEADVLVVVAGRGLGRPGVKIGSGSLLALLQARRQLHAADRLRWPGTPSSRCRPGSRAPRPPPGIGLSRLTSIERPVTCGTSAAVTTLSGASPVRWLGHDVAELAEPEQRHLREQFALARDRLAHDHVEGRQAVAGDHQDAVVADGVVVAHLAAREQRQGGEGRRCAGRRSWRRSNEKRARRNQRAPRLSPLLQRTTCASSPLAYRLATTCSGWPLILPAWPSQPNWM